MSNLIKIPLTAEIYDELDDAFIDQNETSHDFIWKQIRGLCKDAKLGKLNKTCTINVIKDGQTIQDQVKLKEIKLIDLPTNPAWLPKRIEADEVKFYEHKITEKTFEYLNLFASFANLRHEKYAESLETENQKKIDEMKKDENTTVGLIDEASKNYEKALKEFKENAPKCLEEVIFSAVFPSIHQQITENIEKSFDKENEEMYPKEKKSKK